MKVCEELKVPTIISEQIPEKLGSTVKEINKSNVRLVYPKSQFSMLTNQVEDLLKEINPETVLLAGIEAHVCVLQTSLDLRERGFDVHIVADATSSQKNYDRKYAFERIRASGGYLSTYESICFQLLRDAANPNFKNLLPLFKMERPNPMLDF